MLEREKSGLLISEEQQREIGYIIVLNAALQGGNMSLARAAAERLGYNLDEILNNHHQPGKNPENSVDK